MINKDDIDVLISSKLHSSRVPGKNFEEFKNGQSLFDIKLRQSLKIFPENQITLGNHVKEMQAYRELSCNFVEDPPQPISWPDYVPFTVEQLFRPYVLFVRVTTPFINTQLMSQFIDDYLEHHEQYGSSVSVVKIKSQLFDHNQQPINSGIGDEHKNTQEIEEIYYEVAGISIAKREDALRYHYHYAPNPHLFIVDPFHGLDINYPEEWELAQSLAKSDILE